MKGAFARAQEAPAGSKGRLQGRGALFLGRLQGASGVRKSVGHCFWGVRWGKKRVYDFFAADVRFFCKFEFYVHIHYYF